MNTARKRQTSERKSLFFNDLGAFKMAKIGNFVTLSSLLSSETQNEDKNMNRILMLLSPVVILPLAVLCIGFGMPSALVVVALAVYTYFLFKSVSNSGGN